MTSNEPIKNPTSPDEIALLRDGCAPRVGGAFVRGYSGTELLPERIAAHPNHTMRWIGLPVRTVA